MTKKTVNYQTAPPKIAEAIRDAQTLDDFLPAPKDLVLKEDTVRVTIALSKRSVDFFKKNARNQGVPYQTMIKRVLDYYSQYFHK